MYKLTLLVFLLSLATFSQDISKDTAIITKTYSQRWE